MMETANKADTGAAATLYILVDSAQQILVTSAGTPYLHPHCEPNVATYPLDADPHLRVQRVDRSVLAAIAADPTTTASTVARSNHVLSLVAVAQLEFRERTNFDPYSGELLQFPKPSMGVTSQGREVFPRIDPAVIGRVLFQDGPHELLLVARNAERNHFYSLIAGFVGLGETLEDAFVREVLEETGRRVAAPTYVQSQPWPFGGSIMVGMEAYTQDFEQVTTTDGELEEIRWVTKEDIRRSRIPLPQNTSIAYRMMQDWAHREY